MYRGTDGRGWDEGSRFHRRRTAPEAWSLVHASFAVVVPVANC